METGRGRAQRRHVREKATIDHLVRDVYEPKTPDEKHTERCPTTSTGLPVEDQVRKEWKAALARIPRFFGDKRQTTSVKSGKQIGAADVSTFRARRRGTRGQFHSSNGSLGLRLVADRPVGHDKSIGVGCLPFNPKGLRIAGRSSSRHCKALIITDFLPVPVLYFRARQRRPSGGRRRL